jgi:4'-phosphopantetheinyl transferase EntD
MIRSPFPEYVGFAVRTKDGAAGFSLDPAEARLLSPRMVPKRRDEFVLGRAAAHAALNQLGFSAPPPVLQGPLHEPLWPQGYVGSITHTAGIAVCAVCSRRHAAGIGIDLESVLERFDQDIALAICTDDERRWVGPDALRLIRVFSAKEAVFKAFFPQVGMRLEFMDVQLVWRDNAFSGRFIKDVSPDTFCFEFEIGSLSLDGLVLSSLLLSP